MSAERAISEALAVRYKSQAKRDEIAAEVADALYEAGYALGAEVSTVEVCGARVPVETVEAFGLVISLDSNGNAVAITSPYGMEVTEWR